MEATHLLSEKKRVKKTKSLGFANNRPRGSSQVESCIERGEQRVWEVGKVRGGGTLAVLKVGEISKKC